jgi:hypothetical protein
MFDGRSIGQGYPDPVPPGPDQEQTTSFSVADRAANMMLLHTDPWREFWQRSGRARHRSLSERPALLRRCR